MIAGLMAIGVYQAGNFLLHPQQYAVVCDAAFSKIVQTNITDYIQNNELLKASSLSVLNDQIKKQFSCIASITSELYAPGVVQVCVQAVKPVLSVNQSFVLSHAGDCFSKELFTPVSVKQLPDLTVRAVGDNDISAGLRRASAVLSSSLFDTHAVVWESDHAAYLHDKQDPWFAIICSAESLPNDQMLSKCEQLKKDLSVKKRMSQDCWVADVRFDNQIVVYSEKRGVAYG